MKRILAIDQGTTATKTYTLDSDGHFDFCCSVEHRQIYPQPGWVEHESGKPCYPMFKNPSRLQAILMPSVSTTRVKR